MRTAALRRYPEIGDAASPGWGIADKSGWPMVPPHENKEV
jgi:hypothetical protein